jgi:hypothetical protein
MNEIRKFPKTPHLRWLSSEPVRDDKVFALVEAEEFLEGRIVVEEKVDGANLGLSFDKAGRLQTQNRGNFLAGRLVGQWHGLRGWLARHNASLREHLPTDAILFGEWCYAQHSIAYTLLPDWFLGFDVFDGGVGRFWNTSMRDRLLAESGLTPIRCMASGRFTFGELSAMLSEPSAYYGGPVEGLYLRREDQVGLVSRAKLVRPEFVQAIGEHWSHRSLRANRIATTQAAIL